MNTLYVMGKTAALEKLSLGLGQIGKGISESGLAKRLLAGGAGGAATGAALGEDGSRGTDALMGGLVGAGSLAGAGHIARKGMQRQVGKSIRSVPKNMRAELGRSLKPAVGREQQALMPSYERIQNAMPSWGHLKATAKNAPVPG